MTWFDEWTRMYPPVEVPVGGVRVRFRTVPVATGVVYRWTVLDADGVAGHSDEAYSLREAVEAAREWLVKHGHLHA